MRDPRAVGQVQVAPRVDRQVVLADLVVLGHVGVEVVLAVEGRGARSSLCSARPIAIASSTARTLRTGSEPGRPRQTGQTWVLGSAPNSLAQPQNILVVGLAARCGPRARPPSPIRRAASWRSVRHFQDARRRRRVGASLRPGPSSCTPIGQARLAGAEGHRDRGVAGQVGRDREDVREVHRERVARLCAEGEGDRRRRRAEQEVGFEVGARRRRRSSGCAPSGPGRSRRRSSRPRARRCRA